MTVPLLQVPPAEPPLVSVRDLWVHRGGRPILCGVSAGVARGRVTALIGLNGSGKSTLLRTLLGEFPYTGRIEYRCGHDHSRPRPEYVGYVPQRLTVDSRLPITVKDLMALTLGRAPVFGGIGRRRTDRVRAMLAKVDSADLLDVPVDGLSGGQLQRVLLALAVEPQPELLLLDEPAGGIDFKTQQTFYDLIANINRRDGVTILLVSHDLTVVSRFADYVLCLRDGRIQCQGHPRDVLTPGALADTFGPEVQVFAHQH